MSKKEKLGRLYGGGGVSSVPFGLGNPLHH